METEQPTVRYQTTLTKNNLLCINQFQFQTRDRFEGRRTVSVRCSVCPGLTVLRHSILENIIRVSPSILETINPAFRSDFNLLEPAVPDQGKGKLQATSISNLILSVAPHQKLWLLTDKALLGFISYLGRDDNGHIISMRLIDNAQVFVGRPIKPTSSRWEAKNAAK